MSARSAPTHVLHAFLDAVGDPGAMTLALGDLAGRLNATAGHALMVDGTTGEVLDSLMHEGEGVQARPGEYEQRWRSRDPRLAIATKRAGVFLSDVAVIDPSEFERSEICNELLLPSGVRYTLFGNFAVDDAHVLALAFMRPPKAGGFEREEVASVQELVPSLTRAFRLDRTLRDLSRESAALREVLDRSPTALAVIGDGGRVICANAAANELLSSGDGVCTNKRVLTATEPRAARRLEAAVARIASARVERDAGSDSATVKIPRVNGAAIDVVLFPLAEPLGTPGHVLAVLYDPDRAVRLDAALVARLHDLTATEAELAVALASGRTLLNFAADRGCSEQTARTHLKRIFSKTGILRQADLVRHLLLGPAAIRPGGRRRV